MTAILGFDNIHLTGVVNKRKPAKTPIWDRHFGGRPIQATSNVIQMDILEGPEGLMVAISWDAESRKAARESISSKSIALPRFSEHDIINGMDVLPFRAPGLIGGMEAFEAMLVRKIDDLRRRIDRTKEFMAIGALSGSVKDGAGNEIVTYPIGALDPVNFKTADGVEAFDAAVIAIGEALGEMPGEVVAYCGKSAYSYVRQNSQIQKLLNSAAGTNLITTGNLPNVAGVRVERYVGKYIDNNGVSQSFFPDDAIIFAPVGAYFDGVYGPCLGKGGRPVLSQYYAEPIEMDDPPATKIRVESNPLPVLTRPEAVQKLTASYT